MIRDNEPALQGQYDSMPKLPITVLPGILGGVETQMAFADGVVYAPIVNIPVLFKTQEDPSLEIAKGTGEMVALNVGDGSLKWKRDLAQPAYGAATISNDLVFTTTFEGKVIALDRDTGTVVWEKQLPAGTNATVAIVETRSSPRPASLRAKGQQPVIIAYRLGATGSATTTSAATTTVAAGSTASRSSSRTAGAATPGRGRHQRLGRAEPRPAEARRGHGRATGPKRRRRNALLRGQPEQCSDRSRGEVRRSERRQGELERRRERALTAQGIAGAASPACQDAHRRA